MSVLEIIGAFGLFFVIVCALMWHAGILTVTVTKDGK